MYERMLDKDSMPSMEKLCAFCGENDGLFSQINSILNEKYHTVSEIRIPYGKKYGWCVTHRMGKKYICDIFAESGAYTVMIRLTDKQFSAVYDSVCAYTRGHIDNRYPCGTGGWIHYRVSEQMHMDDALLILAEKLA